MGADRCGQRNNGWASHVCRGVAQCRRGAGLEGRTRERQEPASGRPGTAPAEREGGRKGCGRPEKQKGPLCVWMLKASYDTGATGHKAQGCAVNPRLCLLHMQLLGLSSVVGADEGTEAWPSGTMTARDTARAHLPSAVLVHPTWAECVPAPCPASAGRPGLAGLLFPLGYF